MTGQSVADANEVITTAAQSAHSPANATGRPNLVEAVTVARHGDRSREPLEVVGWR